MMNHKVLIWVIMLKKILSEVISLILYLGIGGIVGYGIAYGIKEYKREYEMKQIVKSLLEDAREINKKKQKHLDTRLLKAEKYAIDPEFSYNNMIKLEQK